MRLFLVFFSILSALAFAQTEPLTASGGALAKWNLMPMPQKIEALDGLWVVDQKLTVGLTGADDPRVRSAAHRFVDHLARATGIPLKFQSESADKASLVIHCEHEGSRVQTLGEDESYTLDVSGPTVKLSAANPLGVIHGLQTLLQLVQNTPHGFAAPAAHIEDSPRFPWRGLMLDPCRHWMPVEIVKRTLDGMEAVKMNVLHFHLSENQGFRIESKRFPKLQEMGSGGLYYTQDEMKDIIAYARERGIRVVPEFDMPGHSTSWFAGYPELAAGPGPYQADMKWGVLDPAMDPTKESTYKFLDKFIGEMSELFPDDFFHLGGDEVNGKQWNANPEIQKFKRSHHFDSNDDLQAYFNQKVVKIIAKYKKTPIGWDEVLHPDLPKDVVVQSWRGQESEAKAVEQGHRALLSHGYYLDLMESAERHYLNDPLAGDAGQLSPEQQKMVLGGEACMWSEMVSAENVESRIWPRAAAIAERLWSPADVRDLDSMYARMEVESERLEALGLKHRSALRVMQERLAPEHVAELRTLADVVEPVKQYARASSHKYDANTPLNTLTDSVPPESVAGRGFSALVDSVLSGKASPEQLIVLRDTLNSWKLNHERLQPAITNSAILAPDSGISQSLSTAASIGLESLDLIGRHEAAPAGWAQQQLQVLEEMKKPQGELLLMIVPGIEKLTQAVQSAAAPAPAQPTSE